MIPLSCASMADVTPADTPTPCRLMMPSELKLNVELELSMYARMTSSGTPETAILRISRAGGVSLADASAVATDVWGLATAGASSVSAPAASGNAADKTRMVSLERFINSVGVSVNLTTNTGFSTRFRSPSERSPCSNPDYEP